MHGDGQPPDERRHPGADAFAVVEDEEGSLSRQSAHDRFEGRGTRRLTRGKRGLHRVGNPLGFTDWREIDEPHGALPDAKSTDLEGEARLPAPTDAHDRDDAKAIERVGDRGELGQAADERGRRRRKVVRLGRHHLR